MAPTDREPDEADLRHVEGQPEDQHEAGHPLQHDHHERVIEARWVPTPLALAGQLRPQRLNDQPI
jgi:hypothetical protein